MIADDRRAIELGRAAAKWHARLQREVDPTAEAEFRIWYDKDPSHAAAFDRQRGWVELSSGLGASLLGHHRNLPTRGERRRRSFRTTAKVALAAGLATLAIGGGMQMLRSPAADPTVRIAAASTARLVRFTDGTQVALGRGAALTAKFTPDHRYMRLVTGRARFDVVSDPRRPLVVLALAATVTATGTLFEVAIGDDHVSVTLLRGTVDVASAPGGGIVHLLPGQATQIVGVPGPPPARDPGDVAGSASMLVFDDRRLGDVVAIANRSAAPPIALDDPALADLRVTGSWRRGDNADLAAGLGASLGLRIDRTGMSLLLSRAKTQR